MKLNKIDQITEFLSIVDSCEGGVKLTSQYGDSFNLKSMLTQYVAIAALLGENGDALELWCDNKEDEAKFMKFLMEHPEV